MTVLSLQQIWNLLGTVPFPQGVYEDAMAIVLAESGGNTDAISPQSDYGLFQINKIHFGDGFIDSINWKDPNVQVRDAYAISSGGTNWAAWCTAWDDPAANCGHGQLSHVQSGSAAGAQLPRVRNFVAGNIGNVSTTIGKVNVPPQATPNRSKVGDAWYDFRYYYTQGVRDHINNADLLTTLINNPTK